MGSPRGVGCRWFVSNNMKKNVMIHCIQIQIHFGVGMKMLLCLQIADRLYNHSICKIPHPPYKFMNQVIGWLFVWFIGIEINVFNTNVYLWTHVKIINSIQCWFHLPVDVIDTISIFIIRQPLICKYGFQIWNSFFSPDFFHIPFSHPCI